jgi:hypothetical protein
LERISDRWSDDEDVFVFFNNDREACAVRDAARFSELARRAGLTTTGTVDGHEVDIERSGNQDGTYDV